MNKLTVSIAMTAYNNSKYLKMQLQSILEQTMFPDEIIICEDHSNDLEVKNILEDFKIKYPAKCTIVYNERNLGNRLNYQKVYSLCSGDIIIQCDSDDIWEKTKVEEVKKAFEENYNVSLVFHNGTIIDENGDEADSSFYHKIGMLPNLQLDKENFLLNTLSKHKFPYGMSIAIRKDILKEAIPFYLVQDQWIVLCAPLFGNVVYIDKKLIKYRRHSNNESGNNVIIVEQSKLAKIKETIYKKNTISRDKWFDWVDRTVNDYKFYHKKFKNHLPSSVIDELNDLITYGSKMKTIIKKGNFIGVYNLIKLYQLGLYQKYRGNYNQLLLDIIFTI